LSVTFDFSEKYSEEVNNFYKDDEYFSLEHFAKKHNLGKIKKSEIRENIIKIRKNIYPDIEKFPNVGSTFKNAEVSQKEFEKIFKKYPEIPN
jgi:UDP-N-acetylenolpyruvoylglucosamine reductase